MKPTTFLRLLCAMLALLLSLTVMTACSDKDDLPKGYQNATCNGEYFRLYIPTQWTLNTESGVSGGHYSLAEGAAVSMMEIIPDVADTETATLVDLAKAHKESVSGMKGFTLIKDNNFICISDCADSLSNYKSCNTVQFFVKLMA